MTGAIAAARAKLYSASTPSGIELQQHERGIHVFPGRPAGPDPRPAGPDPRPPDVDSYMYRPPLTG